MFRKYYWVFFTAILVAAFLFRIVPPQNHNFFFTVDQADDAVWVREIVEGHRPIWRGSQTNIPGVYAGPLWYYWLAAAYALFGGDPFGAVVFGILRNVALVGVLMWFLRGKVGTGKSLAIGILFSFFWWFFDTSRWSFNPFPLVTTSLVMILLLTNFFSGRKRYFYWAALPVFLNFNFEVAGASAILLFYFVIGLWAYFKRKLRIKDLAISFSLPAICLALLVWRLSVLYLGNLSGNRLPGHATGYFSGTNFVYMAGRFLEMLSYAVIPYQSFLSLVLFSGLFIWFLKQKKQNLFVLRFVSLTLTLFFVCWIFFSTNHGWYDWHTVFLPPLLFISVLLLISQLPKKLAVVALAGVVLFQAPIFKERYLQYLTPQKGPGILSTQLSVLDWIYARRENDGFNAYTYLPARRDYPYQYLFWWYGRKKYGFVPCEYSIYMHGLKLYVPHKDDYSKPTLNCNQFRFLIIESTHKKDEIFDAWFKMVGSGTTLMERTDINGVEVQKRKIVNP